MRSQFQACVWRQAYESSPPLLLLDPLEHGWMRGTVNKILAPVTLPTSVPPAPDFILRIIQCGLSICQRLPCPQSSELLYGNIVRFDTLHWGKLNTLSKYLLNISVLNVFLALDLYFCIYLTLEQNVTTPFDRSCSKHMSRN